MVYWLARFLTISLAVFLPWRPCAAADAPSPSSPEGASGPLPETRLLTLPGDLSTQMVEGIRSFLQRQTQQSVQSRASLWQRDFSSAGAYERSVSSNRTRFAYRIGATDPRLAVHSRSDGADDTNATKLVETSSFTAYRLTWPVFQGVTGEGLWLCPKTNRLARIIAVPDADQSPELVCGLLDGLTPDLQYARRLAENGCEVIVPALISRRDDFSGSVGANRFTNQPHREWIYRQSFVLGRHIIGYEVQKIRSLLDRWRGENPEPETKLPIGIMGYGEGGLLALYAAAVDTRIQAALVSGYFDSRDNLFAEPLYRNVFGLLSEFGDAEIASMISPRPLLIEHSKGVRVNGPPAPTPSRSGAAPGVLVPPEYARVEKEVQRACALLDGADSNLFARPKLINGSEGMAIGPGSTRALAELLQALKVKIEFLRDPVPSPELDEPFAIPDALEREKDQLAELVDYTQTLRKACAAERDRTFEPLKSITNAVEWDQAAVPLRQQLRELIGDFPRGGLAMNPRSRLYSGRAAQGHTNWTAYEVVLDVYPEVFAWGLLLKPNNLSAGERRPLVVCQHGLEGLPRDVITEDPADPAYQTYQGFGAKLADDGFVVFAPHNPYRGGESFRQLQRIANPLGKSLFSIILGQHEALLDWLSTLPFVDEKRIGFYGLSYGGATAMRVPAILDRYTLSICSGNFNDWIRKVTSLDFGGSYVFTGEYEIPEFNLANHFNHAEMAMLIAPRPFMMERGHDDPVGLDSWISPEFEKVEKLYQRLGIPERVEAEYFAGEHRVNGVGTFSFLRRHLGWTSGAGRSGL